VTANAEASGSAARLNSVQGFSLWLELTGRCDLRCAFCYNPWRPGPRAEYPSEKTVDEWRRAVGRLAELFDFEYVALSGGEPLLFSDLDRLLSGLGDLDLYSILTTNGRLATKRRITRLISRGLREIQVPILSLNPEKHDSLSGGKSWHKAIRALLMAHELGLSTAATVVLVPENRGEIVKLVHFLCEIGVGAINLNLLQLSGSAVENFSRDAGLVSPELAVLGRVVELTDDHHVRLNVIPSPKSEGTKEPSKAWHRCALTPNLGLKLCNLSSRDLGALSDFSEQALTILKADLVSGRLSPYGEGLAGCDCAASRGAPAYG
jgi:pyruvate-formate lyase-activating enzyme